MSEKHKAQIIEGATIYKGKKREITQFESHVNKAAAELCFNYPTLLNRRGELLQQARSKVANEGYAFKKGHSRSKAYSSSQSTKSTPKRPKYDKEMREERLTTIGDKLNDVARILLFKERRLSQSEAARNYKVCEQLTEEIMELKSKRRDLEAERRLFQQKMKRAKRRIEQRENDSTSDTGNSSRSVTPAPNLELQGSSNTPAVSVPSLRRASDSPSPFPASPESTTETDNPSIVLSDSDIPGDDDLHF